MLETLFLPGATGSATFWKPVADHAGIAGIFFAWPGLGVEPPEAAIAGVDDLVAMVAAKIRGPVAIVAQSMGGYVALRLALAFPDLVRCLVLTATSGGLPVAELGGEDWRADYRAAFPDAAGWIMEPVADLSGRLAAIRAPALLLWGDADPISPVAVGRRLEALLPEARLRVFAGADHDLALTHAGAVADEIARHMASAR